VAKGRSKEWLTQFIKDPQAVSPWSIMPKYDLEEQDLNNLSEFLLALDFDRYEMKIITPNDINEISLPKQGD
jgi:cbb3-type cytochrome oxidase cytochrome c subunit